MIQSTPSGTFANNHARLDLRAEVRQLLQQVGPGRMMNTAYDTAWVARLHKLGEPMAEQALNWLREHQLDDGSWGAAVPIYHHDRVICTLAAVIALAERNLTEDKLRVTRGIAAFRNHLKQLHLDAARETVGFEMLGPALIDEARALDLIELNGAGLLREMMHVRETKLANAPGQMISRFTTMAFSAEMAGKDGLQMLDIERLQEENGSVGYSPSATAYFSLHSPQNEKALQYLRKYCGQGGVPNVAPFDVFEQAWVLWNLALAGQTDNLAREAKPYLDFLESAWEPNEGVGFAAGYTPKDADDTSLIYEVLSKYGRSVDLDAVISYEEKEYFRCFQLEFNPSISANIHVLGALRHGGLDKDDSTVQKILEFLRAKQTSEGYWIDKWHASPYYATAHLIIACAGYYDNFVRKAVDWVLSTQNEDGSWGIYIPTAEETAYCLQALNIWERYGYEIPDKVLDRGVGWLKNHRHMSYPPLWIGKCLYAPLLVIRSAILSALLMAEQTIN